MIMVAGKHRLRCGSISGDLTELMMDELADFLYTDPPRGQGALKYSETITHRQTGRSPENLSEYSMVQYLFDIAEKYARNLVAIETNEACKDGILSQAERSRFFLLSNIPVFYKNGGDLAPMLVLLFAKHKIPIPQNYRESVIGNWGETIARRVISPFVSRGMILFDPMCGKGLTAKIALRYGMVFRGNDINEKKILHTQKLLIHGRS